MTVTISGAVVICYSIILEVSRRFSNLLEGYLDKLRGVCLVGAVVMEAVQVVVLLVDWVELVVGSQVVVVRVQVVEVVQRHLVLVVSMVNMLELHRTCSTSLDNEDDGETSK